MKANDDAWERVAGVDEAGRGPLAGPVVAAAVILPAEVSIDGLADSKKLDAAERERIATIIRSVSTCWAVGWADPAEIDSMNILQATFCAMRRAILGLARLPDAVLVDGNRLPNLEFGVNRLRGEAIIGGDDRVAAISAASVLAKTARDRMMRALHGVYPDYDFAAHKGYGTARHREQIERHGPCSAHRQSFAPLRTEWPEFSRWRAARAVA